MERRSRGWWALRIVWLALAALAAAALAGCAVVERTTLVVPIRSLHFVERPSDARTCAYEGDCDPRWVEWNPGAFVEVGTRRGSGPFVTAGALRNSWGALQVAGGVGYWQSLGEPARGLEARLGVMVGATHHREIDQARLGAFLGTVALQLGPLDTLWLPGDEGGALLFRIRIGSW